MSSIGTFAGYNIGKSALISSSNAEDVVGNNIANASTDGYSVENADLAEAPEVVGDANSGARTVGQFGTGVKTAAITRARDQFLDESLRDAYSRQGAQSAVEKQLNGVQAVMTEPGASGINTSLNDFFNSFNDVENNPESLGVRSSALGSGQLLAHKLRVMQTSLDSAATQVNDQVNDDVAAINSLGAQIANLNKQIGRATGANQQPNMLLDQRDLALDKLSKLINIKASVQRDGSVRVNAAGMELVYGQSSNKLSLADITGSPQFKSGSLAGNVQALNTITDFQTKLDNMTTTLMKQVNDVHAAGAGLDGTSGLPLFIGTSARDIEVNSSLINDPAKLAAAAKPETAGALPGPGDSSNAVALYKLKGSVVDNGPLAGENLVHFYNTTITQLGAAVADAKSEGDTIGATVKQLETQRSSTSSVNLDEEASKLIQYQRSYQAAAKVISTNDDMVSSLLSMVR